MVRLSMLMGTVFMAIKYLKDEGISTMYGVYGMLLGYVAADAMY